MRQRGGESQIMTGRYGKRRWKEAKQGEETWEKWRKREKWKRSLRKLEEKGMLLPPLFHLPPHLPSVHSSLLFVNWRRLPPNTRCWTPLLLQQEKKGWLHTYNSSSQTCLQCWTTSSPLANLIHEGVGFALSNGACCRNSPELICREATFTNRYWYKALAALHMLCGRQAQIQWLPFHSKLSSEMFNRI